MTIAHTIDASRSSDEYDGLSIDDVSVQVIDDEDPVDYDLDNDGLIEIKTREQLNAIRYDMDGNGVADNESDEAAYARAFPRIMEDMCRVDFTETAVEGDPGPVHGIRAVQRHRPVRLLDAHRRERVARLRQPLRPRA